MMEAIVNVVLFLSHEVNDKEVSDSNEEKFTRQWKPQISVVVNGV